MKNLLNKIPWVRTIAKKFYYSFIVPYKSKLNSEDYWKKRYQSGGTSGPGSYGRLAEFKAEVLNDFVRDRQIKSIIEFGCGDGNQLELAEYPSYIGFDVSQDAISQCKKLFPEDTTKSFKLIDEYGGETASLTLSLDVIYHLLEDSIFNEYMKLLFSSSNKYVIIYSSNINRPASFHVKQRKFSTWIDTNKPQWKLLLKIPNKYPFKGDDENENSIADFYIFEKE